MKSPSVSLVDSIHRRGLAVSLLLDVIAVTAGFAQAGPSPRQTQDIGAVGATGSASYRSNPVTVAGAGVGNRPRTIHKIPETRVEQARYPAINVHSRHHTATPADVEKWIATMDKAGLDKTIILASRAAAGFDAMVARYRPHPPRIVLWCGLDHSRLGRPDFSSATLAELERCHQLGGTGGELTDHGRGLGATETSLGIHLDDPLLYSVLERRAVLHMPVSVHATEDGCMRHRIAPTSAG